MFKKKTKDMVRNQQIIHIYLKYIFTHNPNIDSQSSCNMKACITFHNHLSYIGYSLLNP